MASVISPRPTRAASSFLWVPETRRTSRDLLILVE
jgi:hypothetical protein